MKMKKWMIAAIAAVGVALGTTAGIFSVKAADTAQSAKEELAFTQVGRTDYTRCCLGTSDSIWLYTQDETHYTVLTEDGALHDIDNTNGAYGHISVVSSYDYENRIYSYNDEGKAAYLNYDGTFANGFATYHDVVGLVSESALSKWYYADDHDITIVDDNGDILFSITTNSKISNDTGVYIEMMNGYYVISIGGSREYFDAKGNAVDLESKFQVSGYRVDGFYERKKCFYVTYTKNDDPDHEYGYVMYYKADLNPYSITEPVLFSDLDSADVPDEEDSSIIALDYYGVIFNDDCHDDNIVFENGYTAVYSGNLKGFDVYYAYKYNYEYLTKKTALVDKNGDILLENLLSPYYALPDKIVVYQDNEDGRTYKIMQAKLKSEPDDTTANMQKITTTVTAEEVDVNNLTDASGNKISEDALDSDATAVIAQQFNFALQADAGVIPENITLSVSKLVSGKEYDTAKKAVQEEAKHVAVFNIDLFDESDKKVQPDGTLTISTNIPIGYDSSRIAVYRLEGDSCIKLESKVSDGKVSFETDHFSTYLVAELKKAQNVLYGDVNGDGEITLMDSALIRRYLAGWSVELDEDMADVDGDGKTSLMDSALIRRYLAGWDVTLRQA